MMARPAFPAFLALTAASLAVCPGAFAGTVITRQGEQFAGRLQLVTGAMQITHTNGNTNFVSLTNVLRAAFITNRTESKPSVPPVTISSNFNVVLKQSPLDSLNGIPGTLHPTGFNKARAQAFTDARTAQAPANDHGWFAGQVTWDLGEEFPAAERQLDIVSIWIRASDRARCDYAGALALSRDGESFRTVPGSHTTVNFSQHEVRGSRRFNQVIYRFAPGAATDFRYLRLLAETPKTTFQDTRYVEVDAWVSRGEPRARPPHFVLLRDGAALRGALTSIDAASLTLLFLSREVNVPLTAVARIGIDYGRLQASRLPAGRTGVLLSSGQFLECEISDLNAKTVTVSSILFGLKRYDLKRAVAAVILRDVQAETPACVVVTRNDSRLLGRAIAFEDAQANVETIAGPLSIAEEELVELRFNARNP